MYDDTLTVPYANQIGTGAAAVLPTKLWYFYKAQSGTSSPTNTIVTRSTFNTAFVDAEAFANSDAWAQPAAVQIPELAGYAEAIAAGETPHGNSIYNVQSLFTLKVGERIYLFWSDSNGRLMGSRSAGEDQWEPSFQVTGASVAYGLTHAISGYVFKDRVVLAWLARQGGDCLVYAASFTEDGIVPATEERGLVWNPEAVTATRLIEFAASSTETPILSIAWTVLPGLESTPADPTSGPVAFVVTGKPRYLALSCYDIDPETGLPGTPYGSSVSLSTNEDTGGTLDLDASNTMYLYSTSSTGQLMRRPLMDASGALSVGSSSPVTSLGHTLTSRDIAQVCFVAGSQIPGQLRASSDPGAAVLNTVATPLYRFLFLASSTTQAAVQVDIQYYGARHSVATVNDLYLNDGETNPDARQPVLVAKGIIDGPLPVPAENLRMMSQGGTVTPWDLYKPIGRVTYGTNQSDDTTHQLTVSGTSGTSFSFTGTAGYDQEWDWSVGWGLEEGIAVVEAEETEGYSMTALQITELFGGSKQTLSRKTKEKELRSGRVTTSEANITGLTRVLPSGAASEDAPPVLSTEGYISGAALSVICMAVVFEDPANPGVLPARPSYMTFMPQTRVGLAAHYSANYAFIPGQLDTYSISAINERMAGAYQQWLDAHPGQPDPFGEDYRNYFERVIDRCALRIGTGGRNFIEFSITNDGLTDARFDLTRFNFEEWGTRVEKSTYSSFIWENSINVAGFEFNSYLESGKSFDFSAGYSESTERSERWGVSAELFNFPQATHQGHVSAYTFRLYLLPADNRWAQEVICFSDYNDRAENGIKPIDPNCRPWKIMFVVDPASIIRMR